MPAPKSILTEKPKPYAPVTNAIAIYEKTLHICLKMPKRYTYLILQDVIRLAGEVMDNTKKANSVFAQNFQPNSPFGNMQNMISQFQQFKNGFNGDPRQEVQNLLNSGKMTQQQFNQLSQLANSFQKFLNGR